MYKFQTAMQRRKGNLAARRVGLTWIELHKQRGVLLCLALALMLFFITFPSQAGAVQGVNEAALLKEIGDKIEKYYLFAPEEGVELHSLDELAMLWQDPHSTYLQPEQFGLFTDSLGRSLTGIGVYLEKGETGVTVVSPVPGSPAERAGMQSGDLIVFVDGRMVLDSPLEKVVALLRGEAGTAVMVTVRRGEQFHDFSLVREQIHLPNLEHVMLDKGLALLRIYNFDSGVAREMSRILAGLDEAGVRGIILDLRANQGGYVDEALALAALFTDGVLLQVREKGKEWEQIEGRDGAVTSLPMVVMVNRGTASGAEIVAAALKDNGAALLVGDNTFGKGTMQTIMPLQHGGYLKMTTAEFASPRLRKIEGTGVEPHFLISDPLEHEDKAALLIGHMLEQMQGRESYLELALQHEGEGAGPLPRILVHKGEPYYPLRALLMLTGRPILAEREPDVYSFTWEKNNYRLDLKQKLLFQPGLPLSNPSCNVLLQEGTTYVPLSCLAQILQLPYLY